MMPSLRKTVTRGPVAVLAALAACTGGDNSDPKSRDEARDLTRTRRGWALLEPRAADVRNGDYLTALGACQECHTLRASDGEHLDMAQLFGGGIPFVGPWGVAASANASAVVRDLPPDTLENAIRGRLAYKFQMPTVLYAQMADDDMRDVVAYLETVKPVDRVNDANTYDPTWRPPPPRPAVPHPAKAPRGVTVERGNYLATVAICRDCHSPRSAASPTGYDEEHKLSGGGLSFRTADGKPIVPPNLTPDPETGLGSWTDDEIIRAIRTGVANDGHRLNPLMPYEVGLQRMTDDDIHALVLYLRSLPPVHRKLPENPIWSPGGAPESCCYPGPVGGFDGEPARIQ
jgi:mono/diheme cytochrome c family protein